MRRPSPARPRLLALVAATVLLARDGGLAGDRRRRRPPASSLTPVVGGLDSPVYRDQRRATAPAGCSSSSRPAGSRSSRTAACSRPRSSTCRARSRTGRSRACSAWPSTRSSRRTGCSSSTSPVPTATRSSTAIACRARTRTWRSARRAVPDHHDRPAVRQPQRRHAAVRAGRLPVHRDGRRRQRRRSGQPGAGRLSAPRQDAADRHQRIGRGTALPDPAEQPVRRPARAATRSGRAACATRGSSRSTGDRHAVDRRRRPGPLRGDRPVGWPRLPAVA